MVLQEDSGERVEFPLVTPRSPLVLPTLWKVGADPCEIYTDTDMYIGRVELPELAEVIVGALNGLLNYEYALQQAMQGRPVWKGKINDND